VLKQTIEGDFQSSAMEIIKKAKDIAWFLGATQEGGRAGTGAPWDYRGSQSLSNAVFFAHSETRVGSTPEPFRCSKYSSGHSVHYFSHVIPLISTEQLRTFDSTVVRSNTHDRTTDRTQTRQTDYRGCS
jgi:hypothetical protein